MAIDEILLLTLLTKNKKSAPIDATYHTPPGPVAQPNRHAKKKTRRINRRVFPYLIEIA